MISIIENEPLINHIHEYDVIIVGTNCYQVMRNGFQLEIVQQYPYIQEENDKTPYASQNKVGTYIVCKKKDMPDIVLAYITFGYNFKGNDTCYMDVKNLETILKLVNIEFKGKNIGTTLLGTTKYDGNCPEQEVLGIMNKILTKVNVDIFTYTQESSKVLKRKKYLERKYDKKININRRPS